ncbi:hypothetical protein FIBSPDRAFT_942628 [Athelia psychrophila]|uniref:Uncharacterized protein n=1 Tax=Athelia psychrophila TaxID=1759441 RepID=A0A166X7Y5_9AGAM|nr:hypothetical protein FIBSPDRAFT_942628 [Fibularhizoctonia sp. CBS 109695]
MRGEGDQLQVGPDRAELTCLSIAFSKGTFFEWACGRCVLTVFENYVVEIDVDGKHVKLALWDTAG